MAFFSHSLADLWLGRAFISPALREIVSEPALAIGPRRAIYARPLEDSTENREREGCKAWEFKIPLFLSALSKVKGHPFVSSLVPFPSILSFPLSDIHTLFHTNSPFEKKERAKGKYRSDIPSCEWIACLFKVHPRDAKKMR